jgi:hypothetical protein
VIRHVVLVELTKDATGEQVERVRAELIALDCPGRLAFSMGADLGLRPGNMDLAWVADFADTLAYQAYDNDPEHVRIRRDLVAPIAARLERCQFEI